MNEIQLGKKTILGRPPVEAFSCPKCQNVMLQQKASNIEGSIFIFKCEKCKGLYKVELNNIKCINCKTFVKKDNAFEKKYCSLNCYNEHNKIQIKRDFKRPITQKANICCRFCKGGVCRNDENRYNYEQICPGECDYFYR